MAERRRKYRAAVRERAKVRIEGRINSGRVKKSKTLTRVKAIRKRKLFITRNLIEVKDRSKNDKFEEKPLTNTTTEIVEAFGAGPSTSVMSKIEDEVRPNTSEEEGEEFEGESSSQAEEAVVVTMMQLFSDESD